MGVLDVCVSVPVCADLWAWVVSTAQVSVDFRIGSQGGGYRGCRGAGVVTEAPGGWPTSQEGWGRMPAEGWRKAWRPRVQHRFPLPEPQVPRQILDLACPLRPLQAPPPHSRTCWVACTPSHPTREEEISLDFHVKIDVFLDKQRA